MNTTCIRRGAKSANTSGTEDSTALHDMMAEIIDQAQYGFHELRALAKGCISLVVNSSNYDSNDDLTSAVYLLHQLGDKAEDLAAVTDSIGAQQIAKGGAA